MLKRKTKASLRMIRLGTKPSVPWFGAAWLRVLEKCVMICWLQLKEKIRLFIHQITSRMHLGLPKKLIRYVQRPLGIGIGWARPTGGVCMDRLLAGLDGSVCCHR